MADTFCPSCRWQGRQDHEGPTCGNCEKWRETTCATDGCRQDADPEKSMCHAHFVEFAAYHAPLRPIGTTGSCTNTSKRYDVRAKLGFGRVLVLDGFTAPSFTLFDHLRTGEPLNEAPLAETKAMLDPGDPGSKSLYDHLMEDD